MACNEIMHAFTLGVARGWYKSGLRPGDAEGIEDQHCRANSADHTKLTCPSAVYRACTRYICRKPHCAKTIARRRCFAAFHLAITRDPLKSVSVKKTRTQDETNPEQAQGDNGAHLPGGLVARAHVLHWSTPIEGRKSPNNARTFGLNPPESGPGR